MTTKGFSERDREIIAVLRSYQRRMMGQSPARRWIADEMKGVSESTVGKLLEGLESRGVIRRTKLSKTRFDYEILKPIDSQPGG